MTLIAGQAKYWIILTLIIGFTYSKQWFHDVKATALTKETFEQTVGKQNHVMIEFFTPWCGYCQQMMGEWNKLFSHFEEDPTTRKDVKICKLNCEEFQEFCAQLGVHQFPTIKLYIAGSKDTIHFYQGNRSFEDFKHWIGHHIAPQEAQQEDMLMQQRQQEQLMQQKQQEQQQLEQQQLLQQQLLKQQQEAVEKSRIEEEKLQQEWLRQRQEELKKLEEIQRKQEIVEQHHQEELNRLEEIERIIVNHSQHQNDDKNTNEGNEIKNQDQQLGNNENSYDIMKTISSLGERITILSGKIQKIDKINGNIDDSMKKLEIIAEDQKLIQKQMIRIMEEQESMQNVIGAQQGRDIERHAEKNGQQQQTVIPIVSSHNISRQSFSVLPAIVFLLAGSALGYLFFSFRSSKVSNRNSLLVSQSGQEEHK